MCIRDRSWTGWRRSISCSGTATARPGCTGRRHPGNSSWSERSSRRSAILAWTPRCSPRRWWRGSPRVSGHCSDRGSPATEPGNVEAHRGSLLTHDGRCVRRWFSAGGARPHVGVFESRGEAELSVSHAAEQVRGLRPERLVTDGESIGVELSPCQVLCLRAGGQRVVVEVDRHGVPLVVAANAQRPTVTASGIVQPVAVIQMPGVASDLLLVVYSTRVADHEPSSCLCHVREASRSGYSASAETALLTSSGLTTVSYTHLRA